MVTILAKLLIKYVNTQYLLWLLKRRKLFFVNDFKGTFTLPVKFWKLGQPLYISNDDGWTAKNIMSASLKLYKVVNTVLRSFFRNTYFEAYSYVVKIEGKNEFNYPIFKCNIENYNHVKTYFIILGLFIILTISGKVR